MENNKILTHTIISWNEIGDAVRDTEVRHEAFSLAFNWANMMGLEGKKVYNLRFEPSVFDGPFDRGPRLLCAVENNKER